MAEFSISDTGDPLIFTCLYVTKLFQAFSVELSSGFFL